MSPLPLWERDRVRGEKEDAGFYILNLKWKEETFVRRIKLIVLLGSILLIFALSGQIKAQEEEQLTADEIIAKTDELMNSDYMEMLVEMKITKPGKKDKIS